MLVPLLVISPMPNLLTNCNQILNDMANISIKRVFNRTNKLDRNGEALIHFRIIIHRIPYYLSTGYRIKPGHWSDRKSEINRKHPNHRTWNKAILEMETSLNDMRAELDMKGLTPNIDHFKEALRGKEDDETVSFTVFMEKDIEERKDIDHQTKRGLRIVLRRLRKVFGEVRFEDLNYKLLYKFDNYLIGEGLAGSTRDRHKAVLSSQINRAIKFGYYDKSNPCSQLEIQVDDPKRDALSPEEMQKLEALDFDADLKSLEKVRDGFLYMCYTGMRLGDLLNFKKSYLSIKGEEMYLTFKPRKKGSRWVKDLPLHGLYGGKPQGIILKYLGNDSDVIFARLNEGYFNRSLKEIANMAGINKRLHSHLGKITFVTDMVNRQNKNLDIVASITGTTSKTLAEHYLKDSPERRNQALKNTKWE